MVWMSGLLSLKENLLFKKLRMKNNRNGHAVVIGAGFGGLLAAHVASGFFDLVTIVERDPPETNREGRPGAPQCFHSHALLSRGHQALVQLFPGIDGELELAGAPRGDATLDTAIFYRDSWWPRVKSGVTSRACSRGFLEGLIRSRVQANSSIETIGSCSVSGLKLEPETGSALGVHLEHSSRTQASNGPSILLADLIIDTSGRMSQTPQWLQAAGCTSPRESVVSSHVGYATRRFEMPDPAGRDWKVLIIGGRPPETFRSGVIYPEEQNRWVVSLIGAMRDFPPTDEAGFLGFAKSLPNPTLYDSIRNAKPISPIRGFRRTESRMRHFETVTPWPDRFIVMGDAACTFNPVYGQGMTVCALSALALQDCLRSGANRGSFLDGRWSAKFQRRLAKVLAIPWLLATSEDSRYAADEHRPAWTSRLIHRYVDLAMLQVPRNPKLVVAFAQVLNLEKSPVRLLHPAFLAGIARDCLAPTASRLEPVLQIPGALNEP